MRNEVYLLTYTSKDDYEHSGTIKLTLESVITYCVHKYCECKEVKLYFVYARDNTDQSLLDLCVECVEFINNSEIPWQVSSCVYPSVLCDNTIITGLCAVSRHICKYRESVQALNEPEDGLLGFRKSCLQAPNEVSIWTKFCEIDLIKTAKTILDERQLLTIPKSLVRFENHLNKPVRIHNVYKIARDLKKENILVNNVKNQKDTANVENDNKLKHSKRTPKIRKWKSNNKDINLGELDITHQFAEGPYFTLADLVLFPTYFIIVKNFNNNIFESLLPLTYKWFLNIKGLKEVADLNHILDNIDIKMQFVETLELPQIQDVSLYKSDPKRHNPKKRLFTKHEDIENALEIIKDGMELCLSSTNSEKELDWSSIPDGANPAAGHLPDERIIRKSQQLENLCIAVLAMAKDGDYIVDFCSGSGHLGILIAHFLPKCTVILLENKEQSLLRARDRVHEMGLQNVCFFQCNLDFFIGKFDIGIALHACGIASDLVLDKCLKANAKFVICPCCYGSLHATDRLIYPRSSMFKSMTIDQYLCIGHTADQTHKEHPLTVRGARCMGVIDSDRARLAEEFGYKVTLSRLKPLSCTPKNNLLIGVPS